MSSSISGFFHSAHICVAVITDPFVFIATKCAILETQNSLFIDLTIDDPLDYLIIFAIVNIVAMNIHGQVFGQL